MPKATCFFIRPPTLQAHSLLHDLIVGHVRFPKRNRNVCFLSFFSSDIRAYPEANAQPNVLCNGSKQHVDHPLESSST